jgi:hypothetical protein
MTTEAEALERVREICLAFPEANERLSHGSPAFFVRDKKSFVMFWNDHHGDGRLALWCAVPPGLQDALIRENGERFFNPPYVGFRGWVGVRLDRGDHWDRVADVIEEAYLVVAPKKLAEQVRAARG